MVHRLRREFSSCGSFSAESQHSPKPLEMAQPPGSPQDAAARRPPQANISLQLSGSGGSEHRGRPGPFRSPHPPLWLSNQERTFLLARFLLTPVSSPQEEKLPLWGSVSLGLPLLVKPWEGTVPRVQGRASEAEQPETCVPSPLPWSACRLLRAPAPWAGTKPYQSLECLSSLEATHPGPSLPLNSMWWRQKFLPVWTTAFLPPGVLCDCTSP